MWRRLRHVSKGESFCFFTFADIREQDCALMSGFRCGDNVCNEGDGETAESCRVDCGGPTVRRRSAPALPACQGDLLCEGEENSVNTPLDCRPDGGPVCGDCFCDASAGESASTCGGDCFRRELVVDPNRPILFDYVMRERSAPLALVPLTLMTALGAGACIVAMVVLFFVIQRRH
jgi:hypothetical protein